MSVSTEPLGARVELGLTSTEVEERRAAGLVNDVPRTHTRSFGEIVLANVVTRFNLLLGSLLAVILVVGPLQDALFGLVLVSNTLIGIVQEVRAKRALDRLTLIAAREAVVIRDGTRSRVSHGDLVLDDVLEVGAGDQLPVDGEVIASEDLEVDESLVTGESDAVAKIPGHPVLSGSVVVAGRGRVVATRVGAEAYASRLAAEARRFSLAHSELRTGIDRFVALVTWLIVPTAGLLIWSQLRVHSSVAEAVRGAVAGTVAMVPEGLVLLTSIAFAVSIVRLARQQVLVQELPAVETLARVDVVAFDKTGTITDGLAVEEVLAAEGEEPESRDLEAIGALAAVDPAPNATLQVLAAAYPAPGWTSTATAPFSSLRKWSGATFGAHGTWILGAPDVVLPPHDTSDVALRAAAIATTGRRVLLLARTAAPLQDGVLPDGLAPRALFVLSERVRDDAAPTIAYFTEQGVTPIVVSGDHAGTVASVARRIGVPESDRPVDARSLPDGTTIGDLADDHRVFGRVVPEDKRDLVDHLRAAGHVVAVTGDGVNDVLALKHADIGIAMGNGSEATRAVAQLVLLDSRFAALPDVVAEGRRVIGNIERVARLFLTKTVYATVMTIAVGVLGVAFPFLPRHLTLIGSLTIGIPAFFLALEPETQRARPHFLRRVLSFAVPAGVTAAAATLGAYLLAVDAGVSLDEARTTATITLALIGLLVLRLLTRPLTLLRRLVLAGATMALLVSVSVPWLRTFFALDLAGPTVTLAAVGIAALTAGLMDLTHRGVVELRRWREQRAASST